MEQRAHEVLRQGLHRQEVRALVHEQRIEARVEAHLRRLPERNSVAVMVVDNASAETLAYVGSAALLDANRAGHVDMVVAPRSLLFNWKREAARFAPDLRLMEHTGGDRRPPGPHWAAFDLVLTTYGRSSGFALDPIEKKPLHHFYPGTSVLSFGTAGCNLACRFCQNWDISKSRDMDRLADRASPEAIAPTLQMPRPRWFTLSSPPAPRLGCRRQREIRDRSSGDIDRDGA